MINMLVICANVINFKSLLKAESIYESIFKLFQILKRLPIAIAVVSFFLSHEMGPSPSHRNFVAVFLSNLH